MFWKGYPLEQATWEPRKYIGSGLIRYVYTSILYVTPAYRAFNNPSPQDDIVREHVSLLNIEIARSLKAYCTKHTNFTLPFRFDVFKFLFKDYNKKKLYSCDFDPRYFTLGWDQFSKVDSSDGS